MAGKPKAKAKEKKAPKAPRASGFAPLKFKEFVITQKGSGRFEVKAATGKNVNGFDKTKILLDSKVLKGSVKTAAPEAATVQ